MWRWLVKLMVYGGGTRTMIRWLSAGPGPGQANQCVSHHPHFIMCGRAANMHVDGSVSRNAGCGNFGWHRRCCWNQSVFLGLGINIMWHTH